MIRPGLKPVTAPALADGQVINAAKNSNVIIFLFPCKVLVRGIYCHSNVILPLVMAVSVPMVAFKLIFHSPFDNSLRFMSKPWQVDDDGSR